MGILAKIVNKSKNTSKSSKALDFASFKKEPSYEEIKEKLLHNLKELQKLETKLWGVTITELATEEEKILEDANHLIYLITRDKEGQKLKKILQSKDVVDFLTDIHLLRNDFVILKRQIKEKNRIKNLITDYTIKLVDKKHFAKLERIFILEKQLYEVIERQEQEFNNIIKDVSMIKFDITEGKVEVFTQTLTKTRKILAGHLDHHALWEEDRQGYSNTSNVLHSLIKTVHEELN